MTTFIAVAITSQAINEVLGVYRTEEEAAQSCSDFWPHTPASWRGSTLVNAEGKEIAFYCVRNLGMASG